METGTIIDNNLTSLLIAFLFTQCKLDVLHQKLHCFRLLKYVLPV